MKTRDINQDQFTEEENTGLLGALPTENFIEVAEHLPIEDIQSLRQTCRFFGGHALLKETMDMKKIYDVITAPSGNCTFWQFKNGKTFGSGSNYFGALGLGKGIGSCTNPMQVILPSNNPIAKIVAGYDFTFCFDTEGNCYFCGCNTCKRTLNSFFDCENCTIERIS